MEQYNKVKFKKSDIIFKDGEEPEKYFYIIVKGKAAAYNKFYETHINYYKEGDIIGLISAITGEPYYSTVEVIEDVELLHIKVENLTKIDNYNLIDKISNYFSYILESWLSKYYTMITKNKADLYNKEDILTMANIYNDNNFSDAAYKICSSCIRLFEDDSHINSAKKLMLHTKPADKPQKIRENIYKVKKGYCIYSELEPSSNIYIIKSGKIGIYSIVNSKQTVRLIYPSGYIINCYRPVLEYKALFTTAIVLEDSIIEVLKKENLMNIINTDTEFKANYIKITATKINSAILKIKAINTKELNIKLMILIYSILKIETLFNKTKYVNLPYKIEDLKNMLNIEYSNKEICTALNKIKYLELDSFNAIRISNFQSYFEEYKKYTV
ncbi:cyclic nucleotide-binding domain-containing protein [Brachyspira murdochii]|uniref:Putative transcriptional regulator, Crp/Fnr family n=1 Tax=Brachyspira murdochii (strain ATCC 51284 / DSM 12563 / 56-150) TaxID=526224 RepID=D5U7P1_BRAM5|nr:cyclic nucleotide-binding domain-containing protein [Brachyspira murdochii]ADG72837.1 putative transcriptional regulator, Crp/Fnr family [Brachyspira murdochii DSM 12563]